MKKRFTLFTTIGLALALIFLLSGCTSSSSSDTSTSDSNESSTSGVTVSDVESKFKEHGGGPTDWNDNGKNDFTHTVEENTGDTRKSSDPYLFTDKNTNNKFYIVKVSYQDVYNKNQTDYEYWFYFTDNENVVRQHVDIVENNYSMQDAN